MPIRLVDEFGKNRLLLVAEIGIEEKNDEDLLAYMRRLLKHDKVQQTSQCVVLEKLRLVRMQQIEQNAFEHAVLLLHPDGCFIFGLCLFQEGDLLVVVLEDAAQP